MALDQPTLRSGSGFPPFNCAAQSKLRIPIYLVHSWYLITVGHPKPGSVDHLFSVSISYGIDSINLYRS